MASQVSLILSLLLLYGCAAISSPVAEIPAPYDAVFLNGSSFPTGFKFGTASSSYQYEGAVKEGGRGPSIWDVYTHKYPERIQGGSNGDVANDQYHRYKEDVRIMKEMNLNAYRFSISWSRLLPNGKLSGGVNKEGIKYYNNLINELLANGLEPFVTLFHFDLPQTLEDEYGGFLSPHIVNYFKDYAELCFKEFGDRVKHWITLNQPWTYSVKGYSIGNFPPSRCSKWQNLNCTGGDSGTEPYLVSHYQLLSHATIVKLYKEKYQASQKGVIGITLVTHWFVPYSNAKHHQNAALRAIDFMLGWFMDPLTNGDYPRSMRFLVGERLPKFTVEEVKLVKGSYDFIGLNYYTAQYAAYAAQQNPSQPSCTTDPRTNLTSQRNGVAIGQKAASDWLYIYPQGIYKTLTYIKTKYRNPFVYITENGVDELNNPKLSVQQALKDQQRIYYHFTHLTNVLKAIKEGANVKGYFAWSFLDNFEWRAAYSVRFGIYYVDYKNGLKRYPKLSAHWFKNFLKNK